MLIRLNRQLIWNTTLTHWVSGTAMRKCFIDNWYNGSQLIMAKWIIVANLCACVWVCVQRKFAIMFYDVFCVFFFFEWESCWEEDLYVYGSIDQEKTRTISGVFAHYDAIFLFGIHYR